MPSRLQVIAGIQHCDAVRVESRMLYISSKPGANHERWWQRCLIAISRFPNHYGLLSTDRCLQLAGNDWQNSWPRWPPGGCKGSHPGSRLDRLSRARGRDRLYDPDAVTKELICEAVMPLSACWNGMSTQVKGSMNILRCTPPKSSPTRSDIWTSRAPHGRG